MIKTALLTIGDSAIADATIRSLAKHSALKHVVYSRKKRRVSLYRRMREYGLLYSLHALTSRILYLVSNLFDKHKSEIPNRIVWDDDMSAEDVSTQLADIDLVVCCLFNMILDRSFIQEFEYCVNIHPSSLPNYRGPEPIYWGLLNKESTFGLTLHYITERIDDGDVILQSQCNRPSIPVSFFVEHRLASTMNDLMQEFLAQVTAGDISTMKQEGGFYLPSPTLANIRKARSGFPKETT